MKKTTIQKEILISETKLIDISKVISDIKYIDTMKDWFVFVIKNDSELSKQFCLPVHPKVKNALLTIIESNSVLTNLNVFILTKRLAAFIATIGDLSRHPLRGKILDPLIDNFQPLFTLLRNYNDLFEHNKTIPSIHRAIQEHRLHVFKTFSKEADLRVALRAFYEDKSRDNDESIDYILNFIFTQLKKEVKQSGHISQPRHAWWALLTFINESKASMLNENKAELTEIVEHLLSTVEYAPRIDTEFTNIIPELDSINNERSWVTINAIRIYKKCYKDILPTSTLINLKSKIEENLNIIIQGRSDEGLKFLQNKLILLYEALGFINFNESIVMSNQTMIDLRQRFIGKYLYDDQVSDIFPPIKSSMNSLIADRSKWTKPTLSSMMICGPAGSGKSEFLNQLTIEIENICVNYKKTLVRLTFVINSDITSTEGLKKTLDELQNSNYDPDTVRLVIFDEFDKAEFDAYTPFLPYLEKSPNSNETLTFYFFAQSKFATFEIYKSVAESLEKKSMKDFLTRMLLGNIDLVEIKLSPQQKIFSVIGMAKMKDPFLEKISKSCFLFFSENEGFDNARQLLNMFTSETTIINNSLVLSSELEDGLLSEKSVFINLKI